MMNSLEIASGDSTNKALVQIETAMIGCETTMLLRSHPIIAISPLGFRHYNNNIYRAVPLLTLWLSLFLSGRVSVTAAAHSI